MTEVDFIGQGLDRFRPIADVESFAGAASVAKGIAARMNGRTLWNINSTAVGGGVAELLASLLPYVRGIGVDARWSVIQGSPEFFRVTKRLHNALHGAEGDGTRLDEAARTAYDAATQRNAETLLRTVRARDVVILHDPQTAGLARPLMEAGALVIWRCHIGHDSPNAEVEGGWRFLHPYLVDVPAFVFSRRAYVPVYCDHGRARIITPSIDAFSAKNQELEERVVRAILTRARLVNVAGDGDAATFTRRDGSSGRVERHADVRRSGAAPSWETPLVVQVSRWDRLKDPAGVIGGFVRLVHDGGAGAAELVLAGPNVRAVADDPEGAEVFEEVAAIWETLPSSVRARIHLVLLPMADVDENAAIVNALQRHAAIIVQKSLREGFGLTVTEAMWKARPVIASAVGGIQDQIVDGVHGILLRDPTDLPAFARALRTLLADRALAAGLGTNARARVREEFLGLEHLLKYARLILELDGARASATV
jgi:trehalose synthase